jgi:hypothetical protein
MKPKRKRSRVCCWGAGLYWQRSWEISKLAFCVGMRELWKKSRIRYFSWPLCWDHNHMLYY